MTFTILDIFIMAVIFMMVYIIGSCLLEIIKGKILIKIQNQRIDALYAKLVRIVIQAGKDYKCLKGGGSIDNQM